MYLCFSKIQGKYKEKTPKDLMSCLARSQIIQNLLQKSSKIFLAKTMLLYSIEYMIYLIFCERGWIH